MTPTFDSPLTKFWIKKSVAFRQNPHSPTPINYELWSLIVHQRIYETMLSFTFKPTIANIVFNTLFILQFSFLIFFFRDGVKKICRHRIFLINTNSSIKKNALRIQNIGRWLNWKLKLAYPVSWPFTSFCKFPINNQIYLSVIWESHFFALFPMKEGVGVRDNIWLVRLV